MTTPRSKPTVSEADELVRANRRRAYTPDATPFPAGMAPVPSINPPAALATPPRPAAAPRPAAPALPPAEQRARVSELALEEWLAKLTPRERARCGELKITPEAYAAEKYRMHREAQGLADDDDNGGAAA